MTKELSDTQKEVMALLGDEEWRMDNLYHIRDKWGRIIKFVRNASQMMFWLAMWWSNVILKDRQRGFSTLVCIFFLDRCLWNPQTQAGIIDLKMTEAKKKLDKVKLAYDHLPNYIKVLNPMIESAAEHVKFQNGSEIWVSTSHRGGTLELLFVSELGPISARVPARAREIKSGALNTVAQGNITIIESSAEGSKGLFFDICEKAQTLANSGDRLTYLDNKFHFFGWWMDGQDNELDPTGINIPVEMIKYFDEIETDLGITLSPRKRAWYYKKSEQQTEDMHREFPSTPDEAFHAPMEGAYFASILSTMRKNRRITAVTHDPRFPVNTGWDLGMRDYTTIWLHQRVALQDRLIGYIEGTDKDVLYYWRILNKKFPDYTWGKHFLPHDAGSRRAGTGEEGDYNPKTLEQIFNNGGMRGTVIVPRVTNNATAIQEVKLWLPQVYIDKVACIEGIDHLESFRREWDKNLDVWKGDYRHDLASHGYKGLESLARGLDIFGVDYAPEVVKTKKTYRKSRMLPAMDWRIV